MELTKGERKKERKKEASALRREDACKEGNDVVSASLRRPLSSHAICLFLYASDHFPLPL